jgi:transcription initiation factor TFIID TATA-box-binding protein
METDASQILNIVIPTCIVMQSGWEKSLQIENIVASAKIANYLDLPVLATGIKYADYNRKRFPGVVIRMMAPKVAALVFGSGKVVITGAKSVGNIETGLSILGDLLRNLGIDVPRKISYTIQNIVMSADLGTTINLNKIAVGFNLDQIEYEPEQFPGLVYRLGTPKVVVLLYNSGKLIITGGREPEDAEKAVDKIVFDLRSIGQI